MRRTTRTCGPLRGCRVQHEPPPDGPGSHPCDPEGPDDHRTAGGHARRADPRPGRACVLDWQPGDVEAVRRRSWLGPTQSRGSARHTTYLRTFLAHGSIDFAGEYYSYAGLFTAARPVQDPFPIKMGAMRGPRSFELAGEIADGLHTAAAYSREALDFTAAAFRRGAERAGRDWRSLDLADNPLGAIAADPNRLERPPASWRPSISRPCRASCSPAMELTPATSSRSLTPSRKAMLPRPGADLTRAGRNALGRGDTP